jgi:RNA-splicing ligase RtcB
MRSRPCPAVLDISKVCMAFAKPSGEPLAPGAYKGVGAVVEATELAGLAKMVARLAPMICIKG